MPLGQGAAVGPSGVPLTKAGIFATRGRFAVIIGVAAVAAIGVAAAVLASGDDPPTRTAAPNTSSVVAVVAEATSPTEATPPTDAAPPTEAPTTVAPTVAPSVVVTIATVAATSTSTGSGSAVGLGGAACVVGSWVADNQLIADAFFSAALGGGGPQIELGQVSGAVRVDIAADGTAVTTFDNWMMSASLPGGAGTVGISVVGIETSTVGFAEDGSFSVSAVQIDSRMKVGFGGGAVFDKPSPIAVFGVPGNYTCSGDRLDIVIPGVLLSTETFTRSG